jgi:hypothetical protein
MLLEVWLLVIKTRKHYFHQVKKLTFIKIRVNSIDFILG